MTDLEMRVTDVLHVITFDKLGGCTPHKFRPHVCFCKMGALES